MTVDLGHAARPCPTDLKVPVAKRKTVATLLGNECRWPIGDPQHRDFHFCGNHKSDGQSYCEYHARLSRQTATRRFRPYVSGER